ncbi:unnamed protein product [Diamesa serratosioi]
MAGKMCRLCCSNSIKITTNTKDTIIQSLITFVPGIILSDDPFLPTSVCQLCHSKAKICIDFISKIKSTEKMFIKNNLFPKVELEDIFKKLQNSPDVSIKKVTTSKSSNTTATSKIYDPNVIFFDEIDQIKIKDEDDDDDLVEEVPIDIISEDESNDLKNEIITESLDEIEDISDNNYDEDSDENYVPAHNKPQVKRKSTNSVETFIDAPIVFNCTKCNNIFNSFNELVLHMRSKVCYTEEFICTICSKRFKSNRSLSSHKWTHKPKTKLMCEECAKTFSNKFDLEMHMQSAHNHAPNKNSNLIFKCTHCIEQFSNHMDLFAHVKEHVREKKESSKLCETCGRNCPNLKSYQAHRKTHSDVVKNFKCNVCDKRFAKGFLLAQHSHIHTGIKMFKCDLCEKSFAKRDSLRIHTKKNHKLITETPYGYSCEDCKIEFKSFELFKVHVTKCNSQSS